MINKKFEAFKLKQELKKSGKSFEFLRKQLNDFGEPSGEYFSVGNIIGLYHEENGFVSVSTGETTQYRNRKQPRILCCFEDVDELNLLQGDVVLINGKEFMFSSVLNIQEWGIIADISLEEVLDNASRG